MKTNFLFLSSFLLCMQSYLFNHIDTTSTNALSTETKSANNNTHNEFLQNTTSCSISRGTTQGLESIVMGRCKNFINIIKKTNCEIQSKNINCNLLWDEFKNAIVSKDPCHITYESFQSFIKLGQHPINLDKSMFWSGTKDTAHLISKVLGYSTLEDTLIGYIVDDLKFCSAQNQSSFITTYCPEDCVTRNNPFWIAASIDFASRASGRAVAILNATFARGGAVSNRSTFMRFEVPNLVSGQLTELKVILTSTPGEEKFETCSQPRTLVYLEQQLKEKNIKYSCEDDTIEWLDTRLLLCFLHPDTDRCKSLLETLKSPISPKT